MGNWYDGAQIELPPIGWLLKLIILIAVGPTLNLGSESQFLYNFWFLVQLKKHCKRANQIALLTYVNLIDRFTSLKYKE